MRWRARRDYSARTPRPFGAALRALEPLRAKRAWPRPPTGNTARIAEPCGRYLSASRLGARAISTGEMARAEKIGAPGEIRTPDLLVRRGICGFDELLNQ
jgi:hypothetical protein